MNCSAYVEKIDLVHFLPSRMWKQCVVDQTIEATVRDVSVVHGDAISIVVGCLWSGTFSRVRPCSSPCSTILLKGAPSSIADARHKNWGHGCGRAPRQTSDSYTYPALWWHNWLSASGLGHCLARCFQSSWWPDANTFLLPYVSNSHVTWFTFFIFSLIVSPICGN